MDNEELRGTVEVTKSSLQTGFAVYRIYTALSQKPKETMTKDLLQKYLLEKPFVFTGEQTDLGYFYNNSSLSLSYINELEAPLKDKVYDVFNEAEKNGLVAYNNDKSEIELTVKGKEFLNSEDFFNMVKKRQNAVIEAVLKQNEDLLIDFDLDGRMSDMGIFITQEKINLENYKNGEEIEVFNRFNYLEQKGLVEIHENGDIFPTEKGSNFLKSDTFKEHYADEVIKKISIKKLEKETTAKKGTSMLAELVAEAEKETANAVVDGALVTAPTGITQGVAAVKKTVEEVAKVMSLTQD